MNGLQEFTKYRTKMEWELRTIAITRYQSRPKRQRIHSRGKIAKFERNMLALKSKWTQMIENVFLKINDQDIYDKMVVDLTKSFLNINNTCEFDGDQFDYALRCAVLPVASLLMSEQEDGSRGCVLQSRRVYFLKKLLYGMVMTSTQSPETDGQAQHSDSPEVIWISSQTPSADVSNGAQMRTQSHATSSLTDNRSNSCHQGLRREEPVKLCQPTPISILVLSILFEAIEKHSQNMSQYHRLARALESRVLQIVNISHVLDILTVYLTDLSTYLSANCTQDSQTIQISLTILKNPIMEYEKKLQASLDILHKSHMLTQFQKQVDSLSYQVKLIKSKLNT